MRIARSVSGLLHLLLLASVGGPADAQAADVFVLTGEDLGSQSFSVDAGDVDMDGDVDLVFVEGAIEVYLNEGGSFVFDSSFEGGAEDNHARAVRLGDVDLDGDLDVVEGLAGYTSGFLDTEIKIHLNDGTGRFTYGSTVMSRAPTNYYDSTQMITLADLDGDGDLEIVAAWRDTSLVEIYDNDGAGGFTLSTSVSYPYPVSTAAADLNGDGHMDLAVALNEGEPNAVLLSDGAGGWTDGGQAMGSAYSYDVASDDLNGDGAPDLVFANINDANTVFLNDGSGSFSLAGTFGSPSGYTPAIALDDLDGDGDVDGVCAGSGTRVLLNDGTGNMLDNGEALGSAGSLSGDAVLADVDGDGDPDLATTAGNSMFLNVADEVVDPAVSISGSCPGVVRFDLSGLTPLGNVALVGASSTGSTPLAGGPCAGLDTGLAADMRRMATFTADPAGEASASRMLGNPAACSSQFVAIDLGSCTAAPPASP